MDGRDALFCREYLIDLDARAAALRAGYGLKKAEEAERWLRPGSGAYRPRLAGLVRRGMAERARRTGISAERVLQEYAKIAFANLGDIADFSEGVRLRKDVAREDMAAVAGLKLKVSGGRIAEADIRLHDKMKALEMLSRHLGLLGGAAGAGEALPQIIAYADGSAVIDTGGDDIEEEAVE